MALIKCKMCGGDLEISEGTTVAECEYCGSKQTVPSADNEKKLTLFSRANRLRLACEFDKAAGVYENIVAEFPTEAEAYWGLVLCRYGIEYVDDPATEKKVPTCHRSSFDSILEDSDFEQACENADAVARRVYRDEAKAIEEIRKGVLEVSGKEEPYDIFICYKETNENGDRTVDSVLAQDVYDALTEKGYRVFFSRITLEDRLGSEYEPYIFAALNSAKIMLAFGTDYEYYNAVWVKNEWSRYLKLMEKDKSKYLIPCYKGIDAYDMPKEFAKLQAQDMGKVGAIQDLLRGIEKIIPREKPVTVLQEKVVVGGSGNNKIASLLDRGNMALEDGDWAKADSFFEDVLNNDSKNAQAYLGKTLALNKCRTIDAFVRQRKELSKNVRGETLKLEEETEHIDEAVNRFSMPNYIKESDIRELYQFDLSYHSDVAERVQQYKNEEKYWAEHKQLSRAEKFAVGAVAENLGSEKKTLFTALNDRVKKAKTDEQSAISNLQEKYAEHMKIADAKAENLYQQKSQQRETDYKKNLGIAKNSSWSSDLDSAAAFFDMLGDYQDSKKLAEHCRKRAAAEKEKLLAEEAKKAKDRAVKKKRIIISITAVTVCAIAALIVVTQMIIPNNKYQNAISLMKAGQYEEAINAFKKLDGYKDSSDQINMCKYNKAMDLKASRQYEEAITAFEDMEDYKDSTDQIAECKELFNIDKYENAVSLKESGQYDYAIDSFEALNGYKDSADQIIQCKYNKATSLMESGDYTDAVSVFEEISGYSDSNEKIDQCKYSAAVNLKESGDYKNAAIAFGKLIGYSDAREQSLALWDKFAKRDVISEGNSFTVGVCSDGTVVGTSYLNPYDYPVNWDIQSHVSDWVDIIALASGDYHTVGLHSDGTVVATTVDGNIDGYSQCDVSAWSDIVAISAADEYTVGLRVNGTVVFTGKAPFSQEDIDDLNNIAAISASDYYMLVLRADGTVMVTDNEYVHQSEMEDWSDIISVSACYNHVLGLCGDGTVVAAGDYQDNERSDVDTWNNIVDIFAGAYFSYGVRTDGTVLRVETNAISTAQRSADEMLATISSWSNLDALILHDYSALGLHVDGTVSAYGEQKSGKFDVSTWTNIKTS